MAAPTRPIVNESLTHGSGCGGHRELDAPLARVSRSDDARAGKFTWALHHRVPRSDDPDDRTPDRFLLVRGSCQPERQQLVALSFGRSRF
jgi:hypothetical protein